MIAPAAKPMRPHRLSGRMPRERRRGGGSEETARPRRRAGWSFYRETGRYPGWAGRKRGAWSGTVKGVFAGEFVVGEHILPALVFEEEEARGNPARLCFRFTHARARS